MKLLSLDDERYSAYRGGYGTVYNVVPKIQSLQEQGASDAFWAEIWEELYHQGDVGEASYAIVPYLVEYQSTLKDVDEQLFQFVVSVDLARLEDRNPPIPGELEFSYAIAIRKLPIVGGERLRRGRSSGAVMAVAAASALSAGHSILARAYLEFGREEALKFLEELNGFKPADYDV